MEDFEATQQTTRRSIAVPAVEPEQPEPVLAAQAAQAAVLPAAVPQPATRSVRVAPPPPPAPPRPPQPSEQRPDQPYRSAPTTPPEVVLVALGLFGLAALVLYPLTELNLGDIFDGVFTTDALARAGSALALAILAALLVSGAAFIALAVGLLRGSRASQLLVCGLCVVLSISYIVERTANDYGEYLVSDDVLAGVLIVSALVILLLTVPHTARAFFAARTTEPAGISCAIATNLYLGTIGVCNGVMLTLAGGLGVEYVWIGVGFGVVGLALLALSSFLRAGRSGAQGLAVLMYIAVAILGFVLAAQADLTGNPSTFVPLLTAIFALGALVGPESSRGHFARGPYAGQQSSPAARLTWFLLLIGLVVSAGTGFAAANQSAPGYDGISLDENGNRVLDSGPITDDTETYGSTPSDGDVYSVADAALSQLETYGSADGCEGTATGNSFDYYSIDDVSELSAGNFVVTATVTLSDGSTEEVSFTVTTGYGSVPCLASGSYTESSGPVIPSLPADTTSEEPSVVAAPADVPNLPSNGDDIPTDAPLPDSPQNSDVISYEDSVTTPTSADELLEYRPSGLDSDQRAAVRDIVAFMTYINQQQFQQAWDRSTQRLGGSSPSSTFRDGYATSRFYQVAFGQPERVADDLIVVPGRFVSRQDPAAQNYPDGVTECTLWPQYVFVVARSGSSWLIDTAGKYGSRGELDQFRRTTSDGSHALNPIAQRGTC